MRRPLLAALVLLAVAAAPLPRQPAADAQSKTLVVTGYGGRWSEVMKKALVEPFEKKYDARVEIVTGITTEWVAKLMAAGPDNPPFDVVMGNEPPLPIPRERGFFEKRNTAAAPNIKNVYDKALIGDTSLAIFWGRIGLAYRTDMGLKRPSGWKDFWDPSYDGKRGSKNKDLAWKLIDMYLSPEVQAAFASELFFSPTNKTVKLPPEVAKKLISGPADVDRLVTFDWNQIVKQRPQWTERWNKELR